jgi:hypothetical protein
MKEKFIKVIDTIDVYGNVEKVNSIIITDLEWWKNNKDSIYNLLEDHHLNPCEIHQGYLLKFSEVEIMETVAAAIDVLLETYNNTELANEDDFKKCSQCGK